MKYLPFLALLACAAPKTQPPTLGAACQVSAQCTPPNTCVDSRCTLLDVGTSGPTAGTIALTAPQNFAGATDGHTVTLTWSAVAGATAYRVSRADSAAGPFIATGDVTTTAYTDTTAVLLQTYVYVVEAVGAAGIGPRSTTVTIRVLSGHELYVLEDSRVSVFDPLQDGDSAPLRTLEGFDNARRIVVDPAANELYIMQLDYVIVIDRNASGAAAVKRSSAMLINPLDIALDKARSRLWVMNGGSVTAYDPQTLAPTATALPLGASCPNEPPVAGDTFAQPCDAAFRLRYDAVHDRLGILRSTSARAVVNVYSNLTLVSSSFTDATFTTNETGNNDAFALGVGDQTFLALAPSVLTPTKSAAVNGHALPFPDASAGASSVLTGLALVGSPGATSFIAAITFVNAAAATTRDLIVTYGSDFVQQRALQGTHIGASVRGLAID